MGTVDGHLVVSLVPVRQSQVEVLNVQLQVGEDQLSKEKKSDNNIIFQEAKCIFLAFFSLNYM